MQRKFARVSIENFVQFWAAFDAFVPGTPLFG
jgi:hypothetical protein